MVIHFAAIITESFDRAESRSFAVMFAAAKRVRMQTIFKAKYVHKGLSIMSQPMHVNRLINETSPYLLQHARNPVDWHPWDAEALGKAQAENKPILLSIGYSACHWCHVMEHESFENAAIARLMNENFINIKVDREERPDLDQIYMNAVQMMTGSGGWPLTVFLTPDLVPFYGGTYFPPEDRHGMPGFPRLLMSISAAYQSEPEEIARSAQQLLSELRRMNIPRESNEALSIEMLDAAAHGIARGYDPVEGGFGRAPKFPAPMTLDLLLRTHKRTSAPQLLEMVANTCRRMASGGIYDQLGGGFHRYSTDARWLVPHFEKMLYDNAQLARLYLHVYQATHDDFFRRIAEETLDYVAREMTAPDGGFYSTQDADSEGVEGKFFVWTPEEITALLGADDAALFNAYYDVTPEGNFEEKNILNIPAGLEEVARRMNVSPTELSEAIARGKKILYAAREKRVKPGRDEKILTAWNGLMLTAYSEAAAILDRSDYHDTAVRNAEFTLANLRSEDGLLLRSFKDGRAKLNGYLDDYAYLATGLTALFETTGDVRWLVETQTLVERMIAEFWDTADAGFFYTGQSHEELIVRTKDYFDNATPAGNSVAADVLLRLAALTGREDYQQKAAALFLSLRASVARYPSAFGYLLGALDFYLSVPLEIAVIGAAAAADDAETRALLREVWTRYLPNKIVVRSDEQDVETAARLIPLLRGRTAINGRPTAFVCEHYSCQQPVNTSHDLAAQLDAM